MWCDRYSRAKLGYKITIPTDLWASKPINIDNSVYSDRLCYVLSSGKPWWILKKIIKF